ncbi:2'-5' RNA ligase [Bathymodiolus platifrons methanotrophic gill symbiont]|uniref:RNA 2',3'-cyclic phosphodiesterase n=1 Tax=Bathymodiolus platifrons methanotrophic gill symbiont TaxID=113268 RepID=UPI000B41686B|nr:RNA 2',3'-cyclic phosphodiesterase [Bathymodiolus platifrons methanotrophic gill symbiont]GAW86836.1 2'-5' RNA ligase [Bathymodiolus platifrons methanotrophic gill symbiont]GFO77025.1 RNA 2',3'-cyclic 3'-phosphodiesterase [Bathymodiolus platifrons methanotrophic gill symbiont]
MKRLFFALWPDEQTRKEVNQFNKSITAEGQKKVKADNLHVTLLFLGNTPAQTEAEIRQAVKKISVQPFVLHFDQLDFWQKPKVLCLTMEQYDPQLAILVDALKKIADQCGLSIEERAYKPHVTLARKVRRLIEADLDAIEWQADCFCLIESCSTADGVHYQVLQRWDFENFNSS